MKTSLFFGLLGLALSPNFGQEVSLHVVRAPTPSKFPAALRNVGVVVAFPFSSQIALVDEHEPNARLIKMPPGSGEIVSVFGPNARTIVVRTLGGGLYVGQFSKTSGAVHWHILPAEIARKIGFFDLSPDGMSLIYESLGRFYRISFASLRVQTLRLPLMPVAVTHISVSPDGRWIGVSHFALPPHMAYSLQNRTLQTDVFAAGSGERVAVIKGQRTSRFLLDSDLIVGLTNREDWDKYEAWDATRGRAATLKFRGSPEFSLKSGVSVRQRAVDQEHAKGLNCPRVEMGDSSQSTYKQARGDFLFEALFPDGRDFPLLLVRNAPRLLHFSVGLLGSNNRAMRRPTVQHAKRGD